MKRLFCFVVLCATAFCLSGSALAQNIFVRTGATASQLTGTGSTGSAGWGEVLSNGHLICTADAGSDGTQNAGSATSYYEMTTTWTWVGGGPVPNPAGFTGHGTLTTSSGGTGSASATVDGGTDFGFSITTPPSANGTYTNPGTFTPISGEVTARIKAKAVASKTTGTGTASSSSDVWVTYP